MTHSEMADNSAGRSGGAVYGGGSLPDQSFWIANSILTGSTAGRFGGSLANVTAGVVVNCTSVGNSAGETGHSVFTADFSLPPYPSDDPGSELWNSIVRGDEAGVEIEPPASIRYCNVRGCASLAPCRSGDGNLDHDPMFVEGSWRLDPCSPSIDSGDPDTSVLPRDVYDLDGDGDIAEPAPDFNFNDRVSSVDPAESSPRVDMGAFEYTAPPRTAAGRELLPTVVPLECVVAGAYQGPRGGSGALCPRADFTLRAARRWMAPRRHRQSRPFAALLR